MADREGAVGVILASVVALNRSIVAEQRAPFEGMELTANQMALLFLLSRSDDGVTPGAAASSLGITAGAVTQLLGTLREAELVESVEHPTDRRSRLLRLTASAAKHVRDYESRIVGRLLPKFQQLEDAEIGALAALLGKIEDLP